MANDEPDAAMMAPIEALAAFMASGAERPPTDLFAAGEVTILENFPPYLFSGPSAVADWARGMREHLVGLSGLRHRFGAPQNFGRTGDEVFVSLPTEWSGASHGRRFIEHGGWCFVLRRQGGEWRIRSYGWAVTAISAATDA
ncbi:MAG TPA: hypothetical protein VFE13_10995 [Caulobacteraceae bacterium]|nr:hypothetical protein [Caulobacteraceae bacterium]